MSKQPHLPKRAGCLQLEVAPKDQRKLGLWKRFVGWLRVNFFRLWPQSRGVQNTARAFVEDALAAGSDTLRAQGAKNVQLVAAAEKSLSEARHQHALAALEEELHTTKIERARAEAAEAWARVRLTEAAAAEAEGRAQVYSARAAREAIQGLRDLEEMGVDIVPLIDRDRFMGLLVTSAPAERALRQPPDRPPPGKKPARD